MDRSIDELTPQFAALDDSLSAVREALKPLLKINQIDLSAKLSPVQRAKLELINMYAANSLFWVHLKTQGIVPTSHGLSQELDRVKKYMARLKSIEDKKLAPKVDQAASKRIMRNALWSAAHRNRTDADSSKPGVGNNMEPSANQEPPQAAGEELDSSKTKDEAKKRKQDNIESQQPQTQKKTKAKKKKK